LLINTDNFLFACSATSNLLTVCYVDITCAKILRNNGRCQTNSEDVRFLFVHNHVLIIVLMVMHNNLHLLCVRVDAYHRDIVGKLGDKQIDNICVDMARFIKYEICHEKGKLLITKEY
jgi:hypothetical protein